MAINLSITSTKPTGFKEVNPNTPPKGQKFSAVAPKGTQSIPFQEHASFNSASATTHVWQAEKYHENSSVQQSAANGLIDRLKLQGTESVLDVGCGDGKLTASINKLTQGRVLGIDKSPEMIAFASKTFAQEKLSFVEQDAACINYPQEFDVIFSSFALQWVPDQQAFFSRAHTSLKDNGRLALTIPLSISTPLEESIEDVIARPEWAPYFKDFVKGWNFHPAERFEQLLGDNDFTTTHFAKVMQEKTFSSRQALENYIIQWFSYAKAVPTELKDAFFQQIMDGYFQREPMNADDTARFAFARVDILAEKKLDS